MLSALDLSIFFFFLFLIIFVGLIMGLKESTSDDYYLADRQIPWWAVAGSIFGTNISANHLVGMLGIGFSIGFAQSHYEVGAVVGLLLLSYVFLPVYRRLGITTLSEFLGLRFGGRVQLLYSIILFVLIFIQMTAAFYIGARSFNFLLKGTVLDLGYAGTILALVIITTTYTVTGGLKAVIWSDLIQSISLISAAVLIAYFTFSALGGWSEMMALDRASATPKMNLYLPSNHPDLPWTGVFTGLMVLHTFYWGTNQYLVQRALAARSLKQARFGILTGGILKLMIPFVSVAGGVAAAYLFQRKNIQVAPDDAFSTLVTTVLPTGYGFRGIVAAGLLGATISGIDAMMNSSATLWTVDIYKKYINPHASDRRMINIGRLVIFVVVSLSAIGALFTHDPASTGNFFLMVSGKTSYFTPGLVVIFLMGMLVIRGGQRVALITAVAGPVTSILIEFVYNDHLGTMPVFHSYFGSQINFLHRAFLSFLACCAIYLILARGRQLPEGGTRALLWQNEVERGVLRWVAGAVIFFILSQVFTAFVLIPWGLSLPWAGALNVLLLFALFFFGYRKAGGDFTQIWKDDRLYSMLLVAGSIIFFYNF